MSPDPLGEVEEGKFAAAVDLLRRTGTDQFQIRYCEEEDPLVWIAAAHWPEMPAHQMPEHWDMGAGPTPWRALFRLCESSMDGGTCQHCERPTAVDDMPPDDMLTMTESFMCWYRYDPELKTFRRACEGVTP